VRWVFFFVFGCKRNGQRRDVERVLGTESVNDAKEGALIGTGGLLLHRI
jgi:hypothetical protein